MIRRLVVAFVVALLGCGGASRAPEATARWTLSERPSVADRFWLDWLHGRGAQHWNFWLRDTDRPVAPPAEVPAVCLLLARLAAESLDPRLTLEYAACALRLAPPGSTAAHLGYRWAERAATEYAGGQADLSRELARVGGVPRPPRETRYTHRISFLPYLDARRLVTRPPSQTGPDTLRALDKTWALTETPPKADPDGLVASVHTVPPGEVHLEIRDPGRLLAFRDGHLVLATPQDRPPAATVRFSAPGAGPLLLVWASEKVPSVFLWPAAFTPPSAPAGPADAVVSAFLSVEDEDREAATRWLAQAPDTPAVAVLRAESAATDPSVPAGRARDARRAAWTAARAAMPALAHFELARLARQGGDEEAALQYLKLVAPSGAGATTAAGTTDPALPPGTVPPRPLPTARATTDHAAIQRELFRTYYALGWNDEATAALDRAERLAPNPCDLLDDRLALQGARGNTAGRLRLVEPLTACKRHREAADLLLDLDRPAEALATLEGMAPSAATDRRAGRTRRRALVALGRLDEARALAEQASKDDPKDVEAALEAADLSSAQTLETTLESIVRQHPTAREARELILARPGASFLAPLLADTDAVIAAYEADLREHPEVYDGPAVRVLDHGASLYFADGRRLRWVHEILAVRTREAAENFGEVNLPEGASAVAVFNRKADGRRLHAEDMPEKESLSLPDVAIGDYIVAVYLETGDNGYLYDTGFLTPRVMLQTHDLPTFRQRTEVFSPDDRAPDSQSLAGAPLPERTRLPALDRAGVRVETHRVAVEPPEDDAVPAALYLPSVRFGRDVLLAEDLDYTRDRVLARRQRNDDLETWARTTAGTGHDFERAARLARAVRERVDGQTGLISDDAPRMWESGHGHRALVLSTALEAAGIPHRLLLARPRVHVPAGPFLQIADFPYPLIALGPHFDLMIDPGPDRAAPGFLPYGFLGGDAVVVWPAEGPARPVPLPLARLVRDEREVRMRLQWTADGQLRGEVEDTLRGQEAIVVGGYLARLDPEARPKVAERLLLPVLGAGQVDQFEDPIGRLDPDGPLVLRYRFTARAAGSTLDLGLFPVNPGRAWANRAERRTPMMIDLPTHQRVTVEVEGPPGLASRAEPEVEMRHGPLTFRRKIVPEGSGRLRIESQLDVEGGIVAPAAYREFSEAAAAFDVHERVVLEAGDVAH